MPLYTFVTTCNDASSDHQVTLNLPDADAAWRQATKSGAELLQDMAGQLDEPVLVWQIEVLDQSHKPIRLLRVVAESYD